MASLAKITIRVGSTRGASQVRISTAGKYVSLDVNTISAYLPSEPIQPTSSPAAFWSSVLAIVQAQISPG